MISTNAEKAIDRITSIYVLKTLSVNYKHKGISLAETAISSPEICLSRLLWSQEFQLGACTTSRRTHAPSSPCRLGVNLYCKGVQGQISRAFLNRQLVCILHLCSIPSFILCRTQRLPWTVRKRTTSERRGAISWKKLESRRIPCRRDVISAPGWLYPSCLVRHKCLSCLSHCYLEGFFYN